MNGSEILIGKLLSHSSYPITQSKVAEHSSSDLQIQNKSAEKGSTSQYIVEDNRIVYEKYDQHGRLIYKVPWSNKPLDVTV